MHTPEGFTPARSLAGPFPDDTLAFAFSGARIVVREDGAAAITSTGDAAAGASPAIPTLAELRAAALDGARHAMGVLAGRHTAAITLPDDIALPPGFAAHGLRSLFFRIPEAELALAGRASQLVEWDRTHRFCGRCGTPTVEKPDEYAKLCPACGLTAWPRVSPAMMALVTRGRDMLLARSRRFANTSMFSALAGFVEAGETVEDCVRREVREEVGLEVGELTYFGSQSWPFPHSLMVAFTAEYAGGDIRLDDDEIVEARWFAPDALPATPPSVSIARRLIEATAARLIAASGKPA